LDKFQDEVGSIAEQGGVAVTAHQEVMMMTAACEII
jgi:hypothetical protein